MSLRAARGLVTAAEIADAWRRIASSPHVRRTPLVSGWEPSLVASNVSLKLESLQRTGSFKVRGMAHVFACAEENIKRNGECDFFLELHD